MTYFADLTRYSLGVPTTAPSRNVGWLDEHHPFPRERPSSQLLDAVWEYCGILVVPTRGLHGCTLCALPNNVFERHEMKLLLGSGEIRVFGASGEAYAAPNLIYHYILQHHYRPPSEFLCAISDGARPGSGEYAERLQRHGVAWRENLLVLSEPRTFRFARSEDGVGVVRTTGRKAE
jgi:hypothetical protein